MGRFECKVALITGAALGQGCSRAGWLTEGADIVAVDICQNVDTIEHHRGPVEEPAETAALVKKLCERIITREVGDRHQAVLETCVQPVEAGWMIN